MGGKAFANAYAEGYPSIAVRRLTRSEYDELCTRVTTALKAHFEDSRLSIPPSFRDKADFGDVDIILSTARQVDWPAVAKSLQARAWIDEGSPKTPIACFALRIGQGTEETPVQYYVDADASKLNVTSSSTEPIYAQVDVNIVLEQEREWRTLMYSYNDIGIILGRIGRRFNFKLHPQGLSVRLAMLDSLKDAKISVADVEGTIHLSDDTSAILSWLQLSLPVLEAGFDKLDDLFAWLDTCKFLLPEIPLIGGEDRRDGHRSAARPVLTAFTARQLERQKTLDETRAEEARSLARDRLLLDAIDHFARKEEYSTKTGTLRRKWMNGIAVQQIRDLLQAQQHSDVGEKSISSTLRGFRRHVVAGKDMTPIMLPRPLPEPDCQLYQFLDDTGTILRPSFQKWAIENQESIKALGKKPLPQHLLRQHEDSR